jgi:hypothetical protein
MGTGFATASRSSPSPAPRPEATPRAGAGEALLVAGGDPVAVDFAEFAARGGRRSVALLAPRSILRAAGPRVASFRAASLAAGRLLAAGEGLPLAAIVFFAGRDLSPRARPLLGSLAAIAEARPAARFVVVTSALVHFGDRRAARAEAAIRASLGRRAIVVRAGRVMSERSPARRLARALGFLAPLVPARLTSAFLEGRDLFAAIERELAPPPSARARAITLLGPNRPWAAVLEEHAARPPSRGARAVAALARPLLAAPARLLVRVCGRLSPRARAWCFDTLAPRSVRELLSLYHSHSFRDVKVVGYNNGVVHFGARFPGRTILSTVRAGRVARVRGERASFDAGVTVRRAREVLARAGKELLAVPNYSYVTVGTAFFVPIHGSASACSTLGATIERVVLYDPVEDRFAVATRGEPAFGERMYDLAREELLLRAVLRVKARSRYYLRRETLLRPSAAALVAVLGERGPSNVEIRKGAAAREEVEVSRFYALAEGAGDGLPPGAPALEVPRDAIGRLWDRIEENRVSSAVFHWAARRFTFHVELFLDEGEFATFWETHGRLALKKIQLRRIARDGLEGSPFRDRDCVSADFLMLRRHRGAFERYLRETLPNARLNPGKHSL